MLRTLLAGMAMLLLATAPIQAQQSICATDTLVMSVPAGTRGDIQWQISPDGVNYVNVTGGNSDTLLTVISGNVWYLAIVTEGDCPPIVSEILEVYQFITPVITLTGSDTLCAGETVSLSAPAGLSYVWSTGDTSQSITVGSTGTYDVTVTDGNGCSGSSNSPVAIAQYAAPVAHAGADTSSSCGLAPMIGGAPAASGGTGPFTYAWSPTNGLSNFAAPNPTANPGSSTTYTLQVTDANGCTATDSMFLSVAATIDSFSYTGSPQFVIVPSCADSVNIQAWGAEGGFATNNQASTRAGYGGYCTGNKAINGGDTLWIYVGGEGGAGNSPGWNGGGGSCTFTTTCSGGGGASDVRIGGQTLNDRVIVAGGGGGVEWSPANNTGGDGGGLSGMAGMHTSNSNTRSGQGGTQTLGGATGSTGTYFGTPGTFGIGGNGGNHPNGHAAGGGGGWYGGGGSCEDGHGGGGSSYYDGMDAGKATTVGVRQGDGLIIITWF